MCSLLSILRGGLQFTHGGIQATSLNLGPGMEFGAKAHNLGMLYGSPLAKTAMPGVAVLQTKETRRDDKIDALHRIVPWLEKVGKGHFGAVDGNPLLLAVRSSPVRSAPGIAKSVIYVGMNDATTRAMTRTMPMNAAYRTYAWFIRSYARGVHSPEFANELLRQRPAEMSWEEYTGTLLHVLSKEDHIDIPQDPYGQLLESTNAVANSMSIAQMSGGLFIQKAVVIDDDPLSGSGVYFTRSLKDGSPVGSSRFAVGEAGSEVVTGNAGKELVAGSPILRRLDAIRPPLEIVYGDGLEIEYSAVRGAIVLLQEKSLSFPDPGVQVRVWEEMVRGGLMAAEKYPKLVCDLQRNMPQNVHIIRDATRLGDPVGKGKSINGMYAAQGRLIETKDLSSQLDPQSLPILYATNTNDPAVLDAIFKRKIAGLITPEGHEYSHAAIWSRILKIPMLVEFKDNISSLIGETVLMDEVTGSLYKADGEMDSSLIRPPQLDVKNYLGIDPEKIEKEVPNDIVGLSIKAIAEMHDSLIESSIAATKKRQFDEAARLTLKAHYLHIELNKLQNRRDPFEVYAWDKQLPSWIIEKYRGKYPKGIEAALVEEASNIDPMFKMLSESYGDRLRLEVIPNIQAGQHRGRMDFWRIKAIVEGGSPYLMHREITISNNHATSPFNVDQTNSKAVIDAREEAKALAAKFEGAKVMEYDLIGEYHDRGLISGTKVIGVLPPLLSRPAADGTSQQEIEGGRTVP